MPVVGAFNVSGQRLSSLCPGRPPALMDQFDREGTGNEAVASRAQSVDRDGDMNVFIGGDADDDGLRCDAMRADPPGG